MSVGSNGREQVFDRMVGENNNPSIIICMARSKIPSEERGRGAELGRALKEERELKDRSQGKIAQVAGLSVDTLRRIEQGRVANPGVFTIASIADALGTTLTHFVPPRRRKRR